MLEPHLRAVPLEHGTLLHETGRALDNVYFPTHGMVSLLTTTRDGRRVETGIIGREGVVGSSVAGFEESFSAAVVQIPGGAYRVPTPVFMSAYDGSKPFRTLVNKYNAVMWALAQQCAACNALHPLRGRIARWLLQCRARVGTDELKITQEAVAAMLGVRRTSVTLEESKLESENLIRIRRGHIQILNPEQLRASACECYQVHEHRIAQLPVHSATHARSHQFAE
jgi:CRP-like cAMP-binding protein